MAENKKSFILYADLLTVVEKLVLKDRENKTNHAGELLYHILLYVNDKNPIPIDFIIEMVFEPIRLQLKRDLVNYSMTITEKSKGARMGNLKRYQLDLYNKVISKELTLEQAEEILKSRIPLHTDSMRQIPTDTISCLAVNVNDNDNDNVNVNVNDILLEREKIKKDSFSNAKSKNEIFSNEILESQSWIETICMQNKVKPNEVKNWIDCFNKKLLTELDNKSSKKDYASHFSRWLPGELSKSNKQEIIPRTKSDYF